MRVIINITQKKRSHGKQFLCLASIIQRHCLDALKRLVKEKLKNNNTVAVQSFLKTISPKFTVDTIFYNYSNYIPGFTQNWSLKMFGFIEPSLKVGACGNCTVTQATATAAGSGTAPLTV